MAGPAHLQRDQPGETTHTVQGEAQPILGPQNDPSDFDEKAHGSSLQTVNTLDTVHDFPDLDQESTSATGHQLDNDGFELPRFRKHASNREHSELAFRTKSRNHNPEPEDTFNQRVEEEPVLKQRNENAVLYKVWVFLKKFPRVVRYIFYLLPGAILLLIPVLLGALRFSPDDKLVGGTGGVQLMWFGIWLEIVWCSLWISRLLTSLIPHICYSVARISGSVNAKKWKDIGQRIEVHAALFLWLLAVLISFKPTNDGHRAPVPPGKEDDVSIGWIDVVNKVIIALFVCATLNFLEKIMIQWIASSFHQRTYSTRILNNKADIKQITHLYFYAKNKLGEPPTGSFSVPATGAQKPLQSLHNNARQVLGKVGYVANRVGNDLIGRKVNPKTPKKTVAELLRNTVSAQSLGGDIYRALVQENNDVVTPDDLKCAFESEEEADAAMMVFDKDLNGDISLEEFQTVCNEVHLEKKAIAASLKDLDSVVEKLNKVFVCMIIIITVIIFISILSGSAAAGLASAGTAFLGLAWVLQATAQEFLQSVIFVFIKHPFDVGDRVTIYGSTGADMTGDDYYVTEISLLYTEFKKLQGQIVQAPNSVLNTLFILNQRRSNGIADVVPLEIRFATPAHVIDELKERMTAFVKEYRRDYLSNILTEMTKIDEARSCTVNFVFMHKSNYQNEVVRLSRHNRFVTELMKNMHELGIQGPVRMEPGGSREYPLYWAGPPPPPLLGKESPRHEQQHHQTDEPRMHRVPSNLLPKHSGSIRSQRLATTSEEHVMAFQDVYESRRDHVIAQRMTSIREKERGLEEEAKAEAAASSTGLALTQSHESHSHSRHRLFGRARSGTRSHQDDAV
ncbi:hypothetical protein CDD82_4628 [Ophiocordyceps australis]|uniref:Mechanosensitive ion channel protein n=1 Tax=Ophiocordyceps australis TaxID=1399860 RepID=A0A2C5XJX3_9HYPO|nr:hypothetical protein CDD82_4628 [Ophiocordyceps australis]